jgi:hypothetical protein
MKEYWVEIIRKETSFERNVVCVGAASAEEAKARVRAHYIDGDDVLSRDEEYTEQHSKHLGVDETEVIDIGEAEEA